MFLASCPSCVVPFFLHSIAVLHFSRKVKTDPTPVTSVERRFLPANMSGHGVLVVRPALEVAMFQAETTHFCNPHLLHLSLSLTLHLTSAHALFFCKINDPLITTQMPLQKFCLKTTCVTGFPRNWKTPDSKVQSLQDTGRGGCSRV
jgi:hypothetical protein